MLMHTVEQRRKLCRFIHIKEAIMISLIVMSLSLLVADHLGVLDRFESIEFAWFEVIIGLALVIEFCFELYYARDRRKYWRHHWFYLLAAIPVPSTPFELLRAVRLLRLLKLTQIWAHMRYEYNTWLFEHNRREHR